MDFKGGFGSKMGLPFHFIFMNILKSPHVRQNMDKLQFSPPKIRHAESEKQFLKYILKGVYPHSSKRKSEKKILLLLVFSFNVNNSQGWCRLKPQAKHVGHHQ